MFSGFTGVLARSRDGAIPKPIAPPAAADTLINWRRVVDEAFMFALKFLTETNEW